MMQALKEELEVHGVSPSTLFCCVCVCCCVFPSCILDLAFHTPETKRRPFTSASQRGLHVLFYIPKHYITPDETIFSLS